VEALGQWVITLPSIFLEGAYLRYLGWMLSDISGPTRHEAVKQLEKILKNTDKIAGIREFVERFRGRIVEMASRDSEIGVRTSAVDLLDLFREAGMLEPDDIDVIGKLIFDTESRVRKAVVGFFATTFFRWTFFFGCTCLRTGFLTTGLGAPSGSADGGVEELEELRLSWQRSSWSSA
jgi:cohesin complex subunit SA-1/2